jgi:cytochrome c oxidase assembly factor CtaG
MARPLRCLDVKRLARLALAFAALAAPPAALAHGDEVSTSQLAGSWHADPVVLGVAALLLALFGQAFVRLRRRGRADHAGWDRPLFFLAALAVGVLPLVSPLDAVSDEYLLSGHMLEHVLIGDAAPALVLVALRGPLLFFFLPATLLVRLARVHPLRRLLGWLVRPLVALGLWMLVMGTWHWPGAYDYTLTHETVHDLEHLCFVIVGTLVWIQLIDPARRGTLTIPMRLGFALALFAVGQVLSDVLIFSFRPLFPAYAAQDERLFGLSPLLDQRLAGLVMMAEQALALGICVAVLLHAQRGAEIRRRHPERVALEPSRQ